MIIFLIFNLLPYSSLGQDNFEYSLENRGAELFLGPMVGVTFYVFADYADILSEEKINSLNAEDINRFDRSAVNQNNPGLEKFSDVFMSASYAGLVPLFFEPKATDQWKVIAVMSAETFVWAASLPQVTKVLMPRNRPFVYNDGFTMRTKREVRARESFFSRTTTLAFAGAALSSALFQHYYPESAFRYWIWGGTFAGASLAGFFKYASGQHFPTDIITGAIAGSAIGFIVPMLYRTNKSENNIDMGISRFPNGETGLRLAFTF